MHAGDRGEVAAVNLPAPAASSRHKWSKICVHKYICKKCGCGRVNAQDLRGNWFATFHTPDGKSNVSAHVPPCAIGPRTAAYLAKYEAAIALASDIPAAMVEDGAQA